MKTPFSIYLKNNKEKAKMLVKRLQKHFSFVTILGRDAHGKRHTVTIHESNVKDSIWVERGFVIRLFDKNSVYEYSFNDFSKSIDEIEKRVIEFVKNTKVNDLKYDISMDAAIKEYSLEVKESAFPLDTEMIMKRLANMVEKAKKYEDLLIDFRAIFDPNYFASMFLSENRDLVQAYEWSQGYLYAVVRKGNESKYYFRAFSGLKGLSMLDEMENEVESTIDEAVSFLGKKNVKSQIYDVILSPELTGMLAHESFGHGVETDMFEKGRAKAYSFLNKEVASEIVNLNDGAKTISQVASYLFDDEGNFGTDTKVIENGIFKSGISDQLSAVRLGMEQTGNGRRESYERKAYSRMTNTIIKKGDKTLEEMIESIDDGYLLDDAMNGMEDPKNWGIQLMAFKGIRIKNGKLTDEMISPVVITGRVEEVLKNISMISKDVYSFGSGACGKGHKELVKVSDGGPYVKTKVRLS